MKEYHFTYVFKNRKYDEFVHAYSETSARTAIERTTQHIAARVQHIKLVGVTK